MGREESCKGILEAIAQYDLGGEVLSSEPYGSGHINDTFLLVVRPAGRPVVKFILQRMNKSVFLDPPALMENVVSVTAYLRRIILESGGDPDRETLNVVPARDGLSFFEDSFGEYWRVYLFIEGAVTYDAVNKPDDFYQSAVAFGNFQRLLADFPADTLHETIRGFHDTAARFQAFRQAVRTDSCRRAAGVEKEIGFVLAHEATAHVLGDMLAAKELPLRVTHNDTKLNNVMIDCARGKGVCVIDLDTVMPGLAVNDFGDSIRFGANTAAEDEPDLSKVSLSLPLFELYVKGYIEGCGGSLTQKELEMLPMGAKVMTFECGMRFLTDYLQGDTYFRIHRAGHNLDRCRTQFELVNDMERKWDKMRAAVEQYQR